MEKKIAEKLSLAAVLEQMAEEAAELAQAALKCARILRDENPTPVQMNRATGSLLEEFADVLVCMAVFGESTGVVDMEIIDEIRRGKMERWLKRLEEKEEK